ncbi:hypothetical protein C8F01DRAFT_52735 [Mycena amicta]|nr:hypothetical protein C8F01DRAFT_52735 [Mycena amicta]
MDLAALAASFSVQHVELHAIILFVSILKRIWEHLLYHNSDNVPTSLPVDVISFLLAALQPMLANIQRGDIEALWTTLAAQIPVWSGSLLEGPADDVFRVHGEQHRLGAEMLYPPHHRCPDPRCSNMRLTHEMQVFCRLNFILFAEGSCLLTRSRYTNAKRATTMHMLFLTPRRLRRSTSTVKNGIPASPSPVACPDTKRNQSGSKPRKRYKNPTQRQARQSPNGVTGCRFSAADWGEPTGSQRVSGLVEVGKPKRIGDEGQDREHQGSVISMHIHSDPSGLRTYRRPRRLWTPDSGLRTPDVL